MKILCVIDSLCAGGAQRQIVELALGFSERGHSVEFLTYYYSSFFISEIENVGINIVCIEEVNYIKRLIKMRRFIRKGKYHTVLSFLEASNFICQFAGLPYRKWKLVVGERSANPRILKSFKLMVYRWFHFLADYIVANSNSNMEYVCTVNPWLSKSKCHIIYNIVDFDKFMPSNNGRLSQTDIFKLIIPARIGYEKNIKGLIEALMLLNYEEKKKIKIDWYGKYEDDGNELLNESLAQIKRNGLEGILTFHDATLDIKQIMQKSDAVGLFSFYEGFPNAICEAMACAKPVICSEVSDIASFLSYEPGLLCNPMDPYSIKGALSYLIKLDSIQLKAIGKRNRDIALKEFEKEKIVSSYLKLMGADH
ncbi:glycosyltransferase [Marinilabiliaceae bacterium JC017]|nr:glycosyltransferase [Marinilabiliaceae bacterium JC017]